MPTYVDLEVSLSEIEPRIWRRFLLTAESSFEVLHDAIQDAFGWERRHLYEFRHLDANDSPRTKSARPIRRIARCRQADILDEQIVPFADELEVASFFTEKDDRCLYLYDFGDDWWHVVQASCGERMLRSSSWVRFLGGTIISSRRVPPRSILGERDAY